MASERTQRSRTPQHVARTAQGLGHRNTLAVPSGDYPFVVFAASEAGLRDDTRFTLRCDGGGYERTLTLAQSTRGPLGHRVLWFPSPPAGQRYSMLVEPGGEAEDAYFVFRDQPLTYGSST